MHQGAVGHHFSVCASSSLLIMVQVDRDHARMQLQAQQDLGAMAIVAVGRRSVPPGEHPSAGVTARKGRERPHLRVVDVAPGPSAGSLTPYMSVSAVGSGARRC